jgi:hypothetical protein
MIAEKVSNPATGSRLVQCSNQNILFGQPPEVLKGILRSGITEFHTLVLLDSKEKDGSLLNNIEFPLYYFLFEMGGLTENKKLNLVGERDAVEQMLRLMKIALLGPDRSEFEAWGSQPASINEWLGVAIDARLKEDQDDSSPMLAFIEPYIFENGSVTVGSARIGHIAHDCYRVHEAASSTDVFLNEDRRVHPAYPVQADYNSSTLSRFSLEVLGGASGFTPNEPCTGLVLCFNGSFMLIDAIPFLDQHLYARGISKNQITACFLTHVHDDHCSLFPLMLAPNPIEIITSKEIFNMAMEKLARGLGWSEAVIREHFRFIEVNPGHQLNYYGLLIDPHTTVHSIPTLGATFTSRHQGLERTICIIGDNHSQASITRLSEQGIVSDDTRQRIENLLHRPFDLLVADGGAGTLHGDPADLILSPADRVVFVHLEKLSTEFNTIFSVASAGKRYTIIEGDASVYIPLVNHYMSQLIGYQSPSKWLHNLLAEAQIKKYNQDDIIIVQGDVTHDQVYFILTGYCDVVQHDGTELQTLASLQAGELIGEMAVITELKLRNASVIARTPVTICILDELAFSSLIQENKLKKQLINLWQNRPILSKLPTFDLMSSTVLNKINKIVTRRIVPAGQTQYFDEHHWYILAAGESETLNEQPTANNEFGWRPFLAPNTAPIRCTTECTFLVFEKNKIDQLRLGTPQLNYILRKSTVTSDPAHATWLTENPSIHFER